MQNMHSFTFQKTLLLALLLLIFKIVESLQCILNGIKDTLKIHWCFLELLSS